jgi:hypothetical protein
MGQVGDILAFFDHDLVNPANAGEGPIAAGSLHILGSLRYLVAIGERELKYCFFFTFSQVEKNRRRRAKVEPLYLTLNHRFGYTIDDYA